MRSMALSFRFAIGCLMLSTIVFATSTTSQDQSKKKRAYSHSRGIVYDLDYIQGLNWTQVLIRPNVVGFVREQQLQGVLETAMKLNMEVEVEHDDGTPKSIQRVVLRNQNPTNPTTSGLWVVKELDVNMSEGKCSVVFVDSTGTELRGFTRDSRMTSLATTAMNEGWYMGYVSVNPNTHELERAKINSDDQKRNKK